MEDSEDDDDGSLFSSESSSSTPQLVTQVELGEFDEDVQWYRVTATQGEANWCVRRRFSEFRELRKNLPKLSTTTFPSRLIHDRHKRASALDDWLRYACRKYGWSRAVRDFCGAEDVGRKKFLEDRIVRLGDEMENLRERAAGDLRMLEERTARAEKRANEAESCMKSLGEALENARLALAEHETRAYDIITNEREHYRERMEEALERENALKARIDKLSGERRRATTHDLSITTTTPPPPPTATTRTEEGLHLQPQRSPLFCLFGNCSS